TRYSVPDCTAPRSTSAWTPSAADRAACPSCAHSQRPPWLQPYPHWLLYELVPNDDQPEAVVVAQGDDRAGVPCYEVFRRGSGRSSRKAIPYGRLARLGIVS